MIQYQDLLSLLHREGIKKTNRTGIDTLSLTGHCMRISLQDSFPLLTTKRVFFRGVAEELFWFLGGSTQVSLLQDKDVNIWNEWADSTGSIGPMYGEQWTNWNKSGLNQLDKAIQLIKEKPCSRRIVVSAWNPEHLPLEDLLPHENPPLGKMALAPCHALFQFLVTGNKLSCILYQRSADVFLGLPFNIASYALLTYLVAHTTGLHPHELVWMGGDVHLYVNHLPQTTIQLARQPYPLPKLTILCAPKPLKEYTLQDIQLIDYKCHPAIRGKIAV